MWCYMPSALLCTPSGSPRPLPWEAQHYLMPTWKPNSGPAVRSGCLRWHVHYSVCQHPHHSLLPCTKPLLPFMLSAGSENAWVWFSLFRHPKDSIFYSGIGGPSWSALLVMLYSYEPSREAQACSWRAVHIQSLYLSLASSHYLECLTMSFHQNPVSPPRPTLNSIFDMSP